MESLSSQPPPRSTDSKPENQNKSNDISLAYKRKSLKHRIECGTPSTTNSSDITALSLVLGTRQCSMYKDGLNTINACVVCDDRVTNGLFAIETVLFIPNKNAAYDNLGRFRIELPRIACYECSNEYASVNHTSVTTNTTNALPLGTVWQNYKNGQTNANTANQSQTASDKIDVTNNDEMKSETNKNTVAMPMGSNNNESSSNAAKTVMPLTEAERDPFDDGFLICTQLVKTGGADQGGLQVGDVFVEFGHYSKTRFPGLKSIANLVRRSAGKEINVVVWRKLEQMNTIEDDGTGRTVFQKLALKLKPLQSHDADGGGVLGAVINTYPLPEMKN